LDEFKDEKCKNELFLTKEIAADRMTENSICGDKIEHK